MMKFKNLFLALLAAVVVTSCKPPELGYFQDLQSGHVQQMSAAQVIKIEPGDKLSILVSSKNPELSYLYNLNIVGHYRSSSADASLQTSQIASYTVDDNGDIDFPILGKLHIAGMSRSQVAEYVKGRLLTGEYLKDATVTVNFLDLYFEVMGEVNRPGRFPIDHDHITLVDALSRGGDMTIFGKRENVLVLREENGQQITYRVDMRNAQNLYNSPAYYIKQNDIVYVEPNAMRANQSTVNGNTVRSTAFWFSLTSLVSSLCVLIFK